MGFGKELRELLKERNLSQETIAKAIGVSQRAVSKWINGQSEPTESNIVACAKYFNITADEILGIDSPNSTEEITIKSINDIKLTRRKK